MFACTGSLVSMFPASSPLNNRVSVTILGVWLGNGTDVSAVYFGDSLPASAPAAQSSSSVTVLAPSSSVAAAVNVSVHSVTLGRIDSALVFSYTQGTSGTRFMYYMPVSECFVGPANCSNSDTCASCVALQGCMRLVYSSSDVLQR